MEFCDPLCNDPNFGPFFWHEDFLSGMNNQRKMIVYIESIIHTLPYYPVFPPLQHITLEFTEIDQDQCLLPTN